jgi:hypothetical protein
MALGEKVLVPTTQDSSTFTNSDKYSGTAPQLRSRVHSCTWYMRKAQSQNSSYKTWKTLVTKNFEAKIIKERPSENECQYVISLYCWNKDAEAGYNHQTQC